MQGGRAASGAASWAASDAACSTPIDSGHPPYLDLLLGEQKANLNHRRTSGHRNLATSTWPRLISRTRESRPRRTLLTGPGQPSQPEQAETTTDSKTRRILDLRLNGNGKRKFMEEAHQKKYSYNHTHTPTLQRNMNQHERANGTTNMRPTYTHI